ncbi:MAG: hypothetical protein KF800_05220 [Lysobacter sp.]|nr:hypothetical protein [Lysobacter sp.]
MSPHTDFRDDALVRAARDAHAASLDHLSPRVQAQLAQRRRAALQPRRSAARAWPMIATASTAALALAIGVFVLRDDGVPAPRIADAPAAPTQPAWPATTSTPVETVQANADAPLPDTLIAAEFDVVDAVDATGYGAFDETPDFYAWLGSEDTLAAVTESL